jgi:hypothetical protein
MPPVTVCTCSLTKQADDAEVTESCRAALEQHRQWRRVPEAMHAAWQAVGAARAKAFPAVCLAPHARKRLVRSSNGAGAGADKRRRKDVEIDALVFPDSQAYVYATVEGKVDKLLKLQQPAKKGGPAASIVFKDKTSLKDQRALISVPTVCR